LTHSESFLAQHGAYTLTGEDQFAINVFERLACEEHFAVLSEGARHPWNTVRQEAYWCWFESKLASRLAE
jgi:hypothetical protein